MYIAVYPNLKIANMMFSLFNGLSDTYLIRKSTKCNYCQEI